MDEKENLIKVSRLLSDLGFELEKEQQHMSGHRTILSQNKLLLVGRKRSKNLRVIIKMSNNPRGKKEIKKELLNTLKTIYRNLFYINKKYLHI